MKARTLLLIVMIAASLTGEAARAQEPRIADCPVVAVDCPDRLDSNSVTFTARVVGQVNATWKWSVSGGKIVSGQGTPSITVNPAKEKSITATVEVGGVPHPMWEYGLMFCSATASTEVRSVRGLQK